MAFLPFLLRPSPTVRRTAAAVLALCAFAPALTAAPRLEPCHVDGVRESVRCGEVIVLEKDGGDRQLALHLVVLPATQPDPLPDPLVILAGGPGQAASHLAGPIRRAFDDVRRSRDIVLIDQRGTGGSNPLDCELGDAVDLLRGGGTPVEALRRCRAELEERADLSAYSTLRAADDLEQIRRAFGWPQINLWGGSYGSRLALVYQDRYAEAVRTAVLDGAAPYGLRLPLPNAASAQRAFDRLVDDCSDDPACRDAFPDPRGDLESLLDALGAEPMRRTIPHPRTGAPLDVALTRDVVAGAVRTVLYDTRRATLLPHLLRAAATEDDPAPLVAVALSIATSALERMSIGLTYTVLCSEDFDRIDPAEVDDATAYTFTGRSEYDAFASACDGWPRAELPVGFEQLRTRQTPTLLLSGEVDPVTPPKWAEEALTLLPRGRQVVAPGVAHITSFTGCAPELIADFLDAGSAVDLDVECLESRRRPPFVVSAAGPSLGTAIRPAAGAAPAEGPGGAP
ncbi:MAG: alpha/beta fold hydrolase [Acidobacteriota bacterium]